MSSMNTAGTNVETAVAMLEEGCPLMYFDASCTLQC